MIRSKACVVLAIVGALVVMQPAGPAARQRGQAPQAPLSPEAVALLGAARVVPIQLNGDPAAHFSLVVIGDGYTEADMPKFRQHLDKHLNILWSFEPYRSYRNYFNVYAVEVVSQDSGITCDPEVRQDKRTALHASFGGGCTNINARGVNLDQPGQQLARALAAKATPNFDQILVIANSDTYGGIGGGLATTTGGNSLSPLITPHEIGHSLGNLQDEYTYSARGRAGPTYSGSEPNSIHMTLLTVADMKAQQRKWWRWLGEPSEAGGIIDRFEGGSGNTKGIWRPSKHSIMISLGYFYDQVSRERMTQRISERAGLITGGTPAGPAKATDVLFVEPARPVYHETVVSWRVDDRSVPNPTNDAWLDLKAQHLVPGPHVVTATVVDPTGFVRDPEIRATALTGTRAWTITVEAFPARDAVASPGKVDILNATQNMRAVGSSEVVFIETTHPAEHIWDVSWQIDGATVTGAANRRSIALNGRVTPGTHKLTATVVNSKGSTVPLPSATRTWTIDNTPPTVDYTLSSPVASATSANRTQHAFMRDEFTMKLDPKDDQPGYLVAEFRVDGDGWHHYYGWPDAPPGTPFKFTARGTNIKELIYGSLSSEGLSPQPWEPREPGWGTRRIEYRAKDAAGNIGTAAAFRVTVQPTPDCTTFVRGQQASVSASSGVTCLEHATITGPVTVAAGATLVATDSKISGAFTATGAATIELVATTIDGATQISGTTARVTIFGSTFGADVTIANSTTPKAPLLAGGTVRGTLGCTGNAVAPVNGGTPGTSTRPATGQCANMREK